MNVRIRIHVYAQLKDYFDPEFDLLLPENSRVGDVMQRLSELKPAVRDLIAVCRLADNESLMNADQTVRDGDELYCLPPASGG